MSQSHGSAVQKPRASLEAIEAARRVAQQTQVCEAAYETLGEAETAFQRGGDPTMNERRARTWAQAAWDTGFAQRGLQATQEEFEQALSRCGVPGALVDGVGAAAVVKLAVGDELPLPHAPDSGSPAGKFVWNSGEIEWVTPPPGSEAEGS